MHLELKIEGQTVVNANVDVRTLIALLKAAGQAATKSTPISVEQATSLINRVDTKSVEFLKLVAENNGFATWPQMQRIFGIKGNEWTEFTSRHGKGITRALRHITGGKHDVLVQWDDDDPEWNADDWKDAKVYIDGDALISLRKAFKLD